MIQFTTAQLARELEGRLIGSDVRFDAISSDSRSLKPGQLFVALKGERFDAHDYLPAVAEAGAAAAMVSRSRDIDLPQVVVPDTRLGLGGLGALWRSRFTAPLVAITGSNGKTTVKEMLASMLGLSGEVLATRGNLNNDIGLPLTLAQLQEQRYAVVEMGANHPGEIDYLSRMAQPDIALLNNAGRAHLEGFGSAEGVARAKAEILNGLADSGLFIYPGDSPWAGLWDQLAQGRRSCRFGLLPDCAIYSPEPLARLHWHAQGFDSRFTVEMEGEAFEVSLQLAGEHNRRNALAAIAVARELEIPVTQMVQGLQRLAPVAGRLRPLAGLHGSLLIDDSYNANPDSVLAAISVLASAPGRRTLVLGALAEMGRYVAHYYREIGEQAREAGLDRLLLVGAAGAAARGFGEGARCFDSHGALIDHLERDLGGDDRVLIKGSRSAGMEQIVDALGIGGNH